MGMFERTMPAFNPMLRAARLTIPVSHDEDYTVIPVKVYKENELSSIVEEGIKVYESEPEQAEDDFDYSDEWREKEIGY